MYKHSWIFLHCRQSFFAWLYVGWFKYREYDEKSGQYQPAPNQSMFIREGWQMYRSFNPYIIIVSDRRGIENVINEILLS